jgi:PAS domain S-box-containing protein
MRDITERRHAEETLREREEHFRSLIENSLDGIVIVDRKGIIRYESPSVERIAGYRPEELTGNRMIDYIHPDDRGRVLAIFKELSRSPGQTVSFESRFKLKNGQWATFEAIQRNLLDDPIVNGYVVNYRDITERKIAEEELRIKENAIENSINAVAMSDMVGTITYVNKACMKLWGNDTKADLLGKSYWSLLEPEDIETAKDIATAMLENQSWEGELRGRTKDGVELYVQVASAIVNDDRGNPIQTISSFIDITERKKAEEALRASEEMFRRFLEEMNDGYCVLEGFNIAFANARCAEMFGYAQKEVIGKSLRDFLPPDTIEDLTRVHTRRQRGEWVPMQYESTLVRKDGTECTVEFGPRIIDYQGKPAVSVVIRDITQRKQMERALRESEAEFRTIFEEAAIGIALIDMEAKPLEINAAFQEMLGYTLDDLKQMSSFDYLHPDDALTDEALFKEMVEGTRDHYTIEKRLVRKDGQVVWGRQNLSLVRGVEGEPRFMIAMIEDITERKRAEEERQRFL